MNNVSGELGELYLLAIIVLCVAAVFLVASIITSLVKVILGVRYSVYNKTEVASNLTAAEVATKMLEALGINDVKVVKCGFWATIFLGNSYSPFKKVIRLRKGIYNKSTITAIAVASQKVAIAKRDHDGDKKIKARSVFMSIGYFSPYAVVPLVVIGLLLDFFVYTNFGLFTVIFAVLAFLFYLSSFIVLLLNLPIEKAACKTAIEYLQKTNLMNEEELDKSNKLFKSYMINYVLDFISELLYILWRILKFVAFFFNKKRK